MSADITAARASVLSVGAEQQLRRELDKAHAEVILLRTESADWQEKLVVSQLLAKQALVELARAERQRDDARRLLVQSAYFQSAHGDESTHDHILGS